jgi:hypothetical protein
MHLLFLHLKNEPVARVSSSFFGVAKKSLLRANEIKNNTTPVCEMQAQLRLLIFLESLRDVAEILCVRVKGSLWSPLNQRQNPPIMPKASDGRRLHQPPLRGSCPFTHRERGEKEPKIERKALIITRNSNFCILCYRPTCQIAHREKSVSSIMESGHRVAPRGR